MQNETPKVQKGKTNEKQQLYLTKVYSYACDQKLWYQAKAKN